MEVIPCTAIIPTRNRPLILAKTLQSIADQEFIPAEIIINDGSEDESTYYLCSKFNNPAYFNIQYQKATRNGAAVQRNEALKLSSFDFIFFMDDDIELEKNCIKNLWVAIQSGENIGGVNALITNQKYVKPGKITFFMYHLMHGKKLNSYAGKCIGPAWNLLPEDNENLPEYVHVDWLNTTCTMYRKDALPKPLFPKIFIGYSLMEDLYLSLLVGKHWQLYNCRTSKIFHNSQPGTHKKSSYEISKMELLNRYYIMKNVLNKNSFSDYLKLYLLEFYFLINILTNINKVKRILLILAGKISASIEIFLNKPLNND